MADTSRAPSREGVRHGPLAELADQQHGVVSIRQLRGPLGYSQSAVARAVRDGRLHRLHRGVYAVGYLSVGLHGRCLAAVLACGPRALLSHGSASWLWGLTKASPMPPTCVAPTSRLSRPPIALHYARGITAADRALIEGIPTTALPRTLLDCAASARPDRLDRMLERAEELRLFDLGPVETLLERTTGHPGTGRLRRAIALYREPVFTRSGVEERFLALVQEAGLPRPATNLSAHGYELDVYWPQERFAVELDVFETHGTRAAFERDRLRQEDLKLEGIEMTRVTGRRLEREPAQVVERIVRLLQQRRRQIALDA